MKKVKKPVTKNPTGIHLTDRKLTVKQQLFVKEYMIDKNATQACIRAGYKATNAEVVGYQLLQKTLVKEAIDAELNKISEKLELNAEYVLTRLQTIAERCMQAEEVMKFDSDTKQMEGTGEYKFDSAGANRSLELLGKHLKLFTDKIEATDVNKSYEEVLREIKDEIEREKQQK